MKASSIILSSIVFMFLAFIVSDSPFLWDESIASFLLSHQWVTFFDFMGSSLFIGGTGIALILYVWWKQKNYRRVTYIVSSLAVGYYAYKGLKVVIGRDRPIGALDDGYSFPSGHSTMSFILFFLICYIISTEIKRKDIRFLLYSACSLLVLFVGMSRLVHGDHYASDVLGGYLVGYIAAGTLFLFYQKWESVRSEESG